jgi:hypothetical protein
MAWIAYGALYAFAQVPVAKPNFHVFFMQHVAQILTRVSGMLALIAGAILALAALLILMAKPGSGIGVLFAMLLVPFAVAGYAILLLAACYCAWVIFTVPAPPDIDARPRRLYQVGIVVIFVGAVTRLAINAQLTEEHLSQICATYGTPIVGTVPAVRSIYLDSALDLPAAARLHAILIDTLVLDELEVGTRIPQKPKSAPVERQIYRIAPNGEAVGTCGPPSGTSGTIETGMRHKSCASYQQIDTPTAAVELKEVDLIIPRTHPATSIFGLIGPESVRCGGDRTEIVERATDKIVARADRVGCDVPGSLLYRLIGRRHLCPTALPRDQSYPSARINFIRRALSLPELPLTDVALP